MNEVEDLKKKKLQEMMEQQQQQAEQEAELQQQLNTVEQGVKSALTKDAMQRFGNIKAAFPEKAMQLTVLLAQALQSGQIKGKINDEQLKELLKRMDSGKKDITITRK